MNLKIGYMFVAISIFSIVIFGIDKATSENPSDASVIRIGVSNIDSSTCNMCQIGGEKYESGCKHCIQDGVILTAHETFYRIGWSNNDGMYHGDVKCDGSKNLVNTFSSKNDTYHIEIIKDDLLLKTNFYNDENFTDIKESISLEMCSNPTNLQYLKISNEDGKPAGNGGKISGFIDQIQIFEKTNETNPIFSTSFDNCSDKTCGDTWIMQNPSRIFVDPNNNFLSFVSELSGTHDYAHLKLEDELPNSWSMKFKFHIDDLEKHPRGKGILNLDPNLRQILFGIPAIFSPLIGYVITRNSKSISFGITMIITGILILGGTLFNSYQNFSVTIDNNTELIPLLNTNLSLVIITISILIIILGIIRMNVSNKKEFTN